MNDDSGVLGDLQGAYVMQNGGGGALLLALLAWGLSHCEANRTNPDKPKAVAAHHLHRKAPRCATKP